MQRTTLLTGLACATLLAATVAADQTRERAADGRPLVSVMELMEQTVTPASNTLWDAWEAPTDDAQWQALEEAAITLLVAGQALALGGTGPRDGEWARSPAWRAYNEAMIGATVEALNAVRARDHDALLDAGDALYPPCEVCHQQFNPAVAVGQ